MHNHIILFNYCQCLHTKLMRDAACNVFIPLPEKLRKKHAVHIQWDLVHEVTGLITRTLGPSNDFTLLNGCTGKCVRLSRLLVGF